MFGANAERMDGRRMLLAEGDAVPGVVRFFSQAIELAEGAKQTWVTITRTGDFTDPRYGDFKITATHLEQMVDNFNKRTLGQDVFLDVAHRPSDGAAGKFLKLAIEATKLRGLVEWTEFGCDAVKKRGFAYLSAEYHENYRDNEKQMAHGCVLLGAGLTTRPVIKQLDPVQLSENDHGDPSGSAERRVAFSPHLLKELQELNMDKFVDQLKAKLLALGFGEAAVKTLCEQVKAQMAGLDPIKDEAKCLAACDALAASAKVAMEQVKALQQGGAGGPQGQGGEVVLKLAADPNAISEAVRLALAERDTAAAALRVKLEDNLKLLSDEIAAGDKSLTPEGVKKFAADYEPLVSAASTPEQVKHLAALAVKQAKSLSAAQKLATLGYQPASGSVHISVDSGNSIKALQSEIDKRLGLEGDKGGPKRFFRTEGKLLDENKAFAEKALAQYDLMNGAQLDAEHKALAAGTTVIADTKLPAVVERTVLREMLYNLVSMSFMDVGTAPFAAVVQIPYSYRDTTAAKGHQLRRYEGQGIQMGGVIQALDNAYPIPQKLGFQVSNEVGYLMAAGPVDYDPIAENVRNLTRMFAEDLEALNCNELVRSADEVGATAVAGEVLTAQVQGTNKIFVLANFPVTRPRTEYDLTGAVAVATVNPITVTLGGTVRNEYVLNADGSALAAATYYIMDYNLGELRFVDQTGAAVTPANATALTVSYSYSTNASKFNTDIGALTTGQLYDNLLVAIGGRKVVINTDRFYNASMVLMSPAVDNMLTQAASFTANGARLGHSLDADGSVGRTKGMQTYNTTAPGIMLADTRIMVGERGNARFRMVRPLSVTPLSEARNANGQFIAKREGYGEQYVVSKTPTNRKNAMTSIVLYSGAGRVARVS